MSSHAEALEQAIEHPHEIDEEGSRLGMWLFLFTELLLFGGMFLLYSVYRATHPQEFFLSATELNAFLGATNTLVLLTSSLTVALSIEALRRGNRKATIWLLIGTITLALTFLVIKYFEWSAKFHHGIFPGSEYLLGRSSGEQLFFSLYFTMTGLHGLHVVIGAIVLSFMLYFIAKKPPEGEKYTPGTPIKLENAGLYWHLVDIIWIFLFPLFYLIT
ncbi:MAG: cytochrome c oxidase subunit 3 family protein [Calditrichia bacterium]